MRSFFSGLVIAAFAIALTQAPVTAQVGVSQNQKMILGTRAATIAKKPPPQLNTLNDVFMALHACWKPPALENALPGMQMTMRFALNRDGRMIGPPQVTYATAEVSPRTRDIYREAMTRSLEGCTLLSFTGGLGGAVAGRPIVVWIVDPRDSSTAKPRA